MPRYFLFLSFSIAILTSCGNPNIPLDADDRKMVDSLSAARIGILRRDIDSICKSQETTLLPILVDSIKKERLLEIKRQLESVPK